MYTAWSLPYVENLSFDINSENLLNDSVLKISFVFTFCRLDVDNLCVYITPCVCVFVVCIHQK